MTEGGPQKMQCANMEGMFRIIQSVSSKKAEPFKRWMAQVAAERINQAIDPERSIDQAIADYRRLGYSETWITQRIKTIEIRKGLTDEWKRGGVTQEVDFAASSATPKAFLRMPVLPRKEQKWQNLPVKKLKSALAVVSFPTKRPLIIYNLLKNSLFLIRRIRDEFK